MCNVELAKRGRGREQLSGSPELMLMKAAGSASSAQGRDSFPTPHGKGRGAQFWTKKQRDPGWMGQLRSLGDLERAALCGAPGISPPAAALWWSCAVAASQGS